ncbi:MAG: hypothetical protein LW850_26200 [Planctomycetaceae bacterium]|jgi:hypothetical protein|nr:hypothetical protein [Planctomycetaceae bacterium]MCE2813891.1 hypothetical protein [Planctomycetaceae bacterium]
MSQDEHSYEEDGYEWDEDSKLRVLERSLSPSKLQLLWGVLLLIVAVAGDLGAASLKLGQGSLAGFAIGLWLAQYLALWLVIHSYVKRSCCMLVVKRLSSTVLRVAQATRWLFEPFPS